MSALKTCERCAGRGVVVTGAEMRAKREATDASLQDVANVLGKTRAAISAMELDRVAWTAQLATAYEKALREAVVVREHRAPRSTSVRVPDKNLLTAEEAAARIVKRFGKSLAVLAD